MSRGQLFSLLETILSMVSQIHVMTQNQETIILHSPGSNMLPELAKNKRDQISQLSALEGEFEALYGQCKDAITQKQDVKQLQKLVSEIMETKEKITKLEASNQRLWDGKQKPSAHIIAQYKKYNQGRE